MTTPQDGAVLFWDSAASLGRHKGILRFIEPLLVTALLAMLLSMLLAALVGVYAGGRILLTGEPFELFGKWIDSVPVAIFMFVFGSFYGLVLPKVIFDLLFLKETRILVDSESRDVRIEKTYRFFGNRTSSVRLDEITGVEVRFHSGEEDYYTLRLATKSSLFKGLDLEYTTFHEMAAAQVEADRLTQALKTAGWLREDSKAV